jgi:hypothetical protein
MGSEAGEYEMFVKKRKKWKRNRRKLKKGKVLKCAN